MVHFYIYVVDNKIVYTEVSDFEILSEQYHSLYYGPEEEMPNFLPKGLRTPRGGHIYAYINGEIVERSPEEIAAEEDAANPIDDYNPQDDTDAMLVDLEYRLTLLELGITESEVAE